MPTKKLRVTKKTLPRITKLNKALQAAVAQATPKKRGVVLDDREPKNARLLVKAMGAFICAVCRDVLAYDEKLFNTDEHGPMNLNKVHEELVVLKADRDAWKTRCENIEAAFNKLSDEKVPF